MICPPFLQPGDTVGIVAPASWFPYAELSDALRILRNDWQLNVVEGRSLHVTDGPFAGSDELRQADLQQFFDDPTIRAVFAARGGYGCYRIADGLDLTGLLANPKWLIGFSDITVLLSLLYKHNVISLHGLMPRQYGESDRADSLESVRQWLFGQCPAFYNVASHALNRTGRAVGKLVGGNLTLLINSIETPTDVDFTNTILFIEEIDETLFSLDRMMRQLRRSGRLANLAGLVVGQFTDMRSNLSLPFGKDANEIIADVVTDYDFPVLFNFPAGHVTYNLALPIGHTTELVVQEDAAQLLFPRII